MYGPPDYTETNERHLCRHCGMRFGLHGGIDNPYRAWACPATPRFPKWPRIKDEVLAGQLYDSRLEWYWTKRNTRFEPV
jgi:hypothetical protein